MKKLKKTVSVILSVVMVLSILPLSVYAATTEYSMGLIVEDWDSDDAPIETSSGNTVLPTSTDLTDQFPTPGDQGGLGSCTAWAVCYALVSGQ